MDYYKALIVLIVYLCLRTIYRLALHPLRGIPGPKLAASTSLYEFYYDAVKGGKYIWEVERMHRQYGKSFTEAILSSFNIDKGERSHSTNQS